MGNDLILLDGFRYELTFYEGVRRQGKPDPEKAVKVTFYDDERGHDVEAWFTEAAWERFRADVNGGVYVPSADTADRLGL